jgi:hypothetical protein
MAKRSRTRSRFEEMYALAVTAHKNGWIAEQSAKELEELLARNPDLVDDGAKETARLEFRAMADPSLAGALPSIRAATERYMANKPAGTSARFHHEFLKRCRLARKQGIAAVAP